MDNSYEDSPSTVYQYAHLCRCSVVATLLEGSHIDIMVLQINGFYQTILLSIHFVIMFKIRNIKQFKIDGYCLTWLQ